MKTALENLQNLYWNENRTEPPFGGFFDNTDAGLSECVIQLIGLRHGYLISATLPRPGQLLPGLVYAISRGRALVVELRAELREATSREVCEQRRADIERAGGLYFVATGFQELWDWFHHADVFSEPFEPREGRHA